MNAQSKMDNEAAFEADVEVHGLEHMHSRSSHRSTDKGHDTVKASLGGFESEREIYDEESPLLSPDRVGGSREASDDGADAPRGPQKWDAERDFAGLPWWKKPSVRKTPIDV